MITADYAYSATVPSPTTSPYNLTSYPVETNMHVTVNFIPNPFFQCSTGTYWGLFYDTTVSDDITNAAFESAGLVKMTVKPGDTKTGKQVISGTLYAEGQKVAFTIDPNLTGYGITTVTNKVIPADYYQIGVQLNLVDQLTATGTVQCLNPLKLWNATFTANRSPYGDPLKGLAGAAPMATNYTMVIAGSDNAGEPEGNGYVALNLGLKGIVVKAGRNADTAPVKLISGVNVSTGGAWPYYQALYYDSATKLYHGSILGWLTFENGSIDGKLEWNKKTTSSSLISTYPNGFTNESTITASGWTNNGAAPFNACFPFSLGDVVASGGYLTTLTTNSFSQIWTNDLVIPANLNKPIFGKNKASTKPGMGYTNNVNSVTLTLAPLTGQIKGGFVNDQATKTTTFSYEGVILQNTTNAFGLHWVKAGTGSPATITGPVSVQQH